MNAMGEYEHSGIYSFNRRDFFGWREPTVN